MVLSSKPIHWLDRLSRPPNYRTYAQKCRTQRDIVAFESGSSLLFRASKCAKINALTAAITLLPDSTRPFMAGSPLSYCVWPGAGAPPAALTGHLRWGLQCVSPALALGLLWLLGGNWQPAGSPLMDGPWAHGVLGLGAWAWARAAENLHHRGHHGLAGAALMAAALGAILPAFARLSADGLYVALSLPAALFAAGAGLVLDAVQMLLFPNNEMYLFGGCHQDAKKSLNQVDLTLAEEASRHHWRYKTFQRPNYAPTIYGAVCPQVGHLGPQQTLAAGRKRTEAIEHDMLAFCRLHKLLMPNLDWFYMFAEQANLSAYLKDLETLMGLVGSQENQALFYTRYAIGAEARGRVILFGDMWRRCLAVSPADRPQWTNAPNSYTRDEVMWMLRDALSLKGPDDTREAYFSRHFLQVAWPKDSPRAKFTYARSVPVMAAPLVVHADCLILRLKRYVTKMLQVQNVDAVVELLVRCRETFISLCVDIERLTKIIQQTLPQHAGHSEELLAVTQFIKAWANRNKVKRKLRHFIHRPVKYWHEDKLPFDGRLTNNDKRLAKATFLLIQALYEQIDDEGTLIAPKRVTLS